MNFGGSFESENVTGDNNKAYQPTHHKIMNRQDQKSNFDKIFTESVTYLGNGFQASKQNKMVYPTDNIYFLNPYQITSFTSDQLMFFFRMALLAMKEAQSEYCVAIIKVLLKSCIKNISNDIKIISLRQVSHILACYRM